MNFEDTIWKSKTTPLAAGHWKTYSQPQGDTHSLLLFSGQVCAAHCGMPGTHTHTYPMRARTHTCTHASAHTHLHTHTCTHAPTHTCTHTPAHMHTQFPSPSSPKSIDLNPENLLLETYSIIKIYMITSYIYANIYDYSYASRIVFIIMKSTGHCKCFSFRNW